MEIAIREDDAEGPEIRALLSVHLAHAAAHSPRESMHALDSASLRAPGITFWTAWNHLDLVGCGALKELDPRHGEIKSMHTAERFRGRGVAARILQHIIDEAKRRDYHRLSLETGSWLGFAPARALYARAGFEDCAPFATYRLDPSSVFVTLDLCTPR